MQDSWRSDSGRRAASRLPLEREAHVSRRSVNRRSFLGSVGLVSVAGSTLGRPIPAEASSSVVPLDPKAPLRIGMVGREGHLGYVLDELSSVPGARITAYAFEDGEWEFNCDGTRRNGRYDLDGVRRWVESQAWSQSGPRLYETYQAMLDHEALDLVVVCLPYARNAHAIAAAAREGLHVLSEKPVAVSLPDLEMVERAVRENQVRLSAMFAMRYLPNLYTMRKAVRNGLIGHPILARAQKSYKWGSERPWFYRHAEIYGSTLLWVGIHAVDYLRWTTGLEVMRVGGFHSNLAHQDYPGVQDNVSICLELEGGATGTVTADFLRPEGAPTHGDDRLRIAGSRGILETMDPDGRVERFSPEDLPESVHLEIPPRSLLADFVGELRGQGTHLIGPEEAVRVTRICIVATQAADEGRVLPVWSV